MITGRCHSGQIDFEVNGELRPVVYYHCEHCRKISGHYLAAAQAENQHLKIHGEPKWYRSSPGFERGFCSNCGCPLFWRAKGEDTTSIMAGAFDANTKLAAAKHIYYDAKAEYYSICDGLPQFETPKECS